MKLEAILAKIPEAERAAVLAEIRQAKSADDIAAIADRYGIKADAQALFDKFSADDAEIDDESLQGVAGGVNWSAFSGCMAACACSSAN